MRIDHRNHVLARLFAVVTIFVLLMMVANETVRSESWPWLRYVVLGVLTVLAAVTLWLQRRQVLVADFDEHGIALFTIRGRVERPWESFDRAVISLRTIGPLQVVVLTLIGKDRRRFRMAIRESHWRQLSQIAELAKKVELKS